MEKLSIFFSDSIGEILKRDQSMKSLKENFDIKKYGGLYLT